MGTTRSCTLAALKEHRRERIDPTIARHIGRIVKTTGDGLLVEFASVVDAVACAVAIQRTMLAFNTGNHVDRQIVLRIGINVGDIILDGGDIFGDGLNVAARLEALCEPGGVCISRYANEQVRDKLSLAFADLGEQTVKNIARAVGEFGLSRDVMDLIAEDHAVPLVPAATAAAYRGKTLDLRMIGRDHNVHFAVTGNARRRDGRLIVTAILRDHVAAARSLAARSS